MGNFKGKRVIFQILRYVDKKLSCQSSQAGSGTLEDHNISHPVQVLDAKKSNYKLQRMRQAGGELFG